jgi:hypothetical protein
MNILNICYICGLLYAFDIPLTQYSGVLAQLELIADPYRFVVWIADHMEQSKACLKCKKDIGEKDLHKIVIYVVQEKFTEHHYEHVECPDKFTI